MSTELTFKIPFTMNYLYMIPEILLPLVRFTTEIATVFLIPMDCLYMFLQFSFVLCPIIT